MKKEELKKEEMETIKTVAIQNEDVDVVKEEENECRPILFGQVSF
ncbi:hypothetical protein [Butyrivibrio sp. NC3005]|nr:hypothetical protein [Butyrivibrio sp. NC3005]